MPTTFAEHVFAIVDKRDPEGFAALLAPDGRFTFANADPVVGRPAVAAAVEAFFATLVALRHEIVNNWEIGADTVVEVFVEYDRPDGRLVRLPAVTIFTRDDTGLITDYRAYVDLAPLFAP